MHTFHVEPRRGVAPDRPSYFYTFVLMWVWHGLAGVDLTSHIAT